MTKQQQTISRRAANRTWQNRNAAWSFRSRQWAKARAEALAAAESK